jgi:hypothetical protein
VYRLSQAAFDRVQPWAMEKLERYHVGGLLWGTEMAANWRTR